MQDSLEAHEEFLEKHQVALERESIAVEMQEWAQDEDGVQFKPSGVGDHEKIEKEEEAADGGLHPLDEPPVIAAPSEMLGPGPLMTDVEDVDELETIFLSLKKSLRMDDLPDLQDLEDVDAEAPPSLFSPDQALSPNMGVVSCSTDDDEDDVEDDDDEDAAREQSRVVPAFALDRPPTLTLALETKPLHSKEASLAYSEDEDLLELQPHSIFGAAAKPRPLIAPSRPSCLIEEIDDF